MITERAIFEILHYNPFVSNLEGFEGEAASIYLHHQSSSLAVESNSPKTHQCQLPIKTKWLMPDSILSFFYGPRPIPIEVTRKNSFDLSKKLNWAFLGLWYSLGQDANPLSQLIYLHATFQYYSRPS